MSLTPAEYDERRLLIMAQAAWMLREEIASTVARIRRMFDDFPDPEHARARAEEMIRGWQLAKDQKEDEDYGVL